MPETERETKTQAAAEGAAAMVAEDRQIPHLAMLFAAQKAGLSERRRSFGLAARRAALSRLHQAIVAQEEEIIAALRADFGKPATETLLTEILPLRQDIRLALKRLPGWMRDRRVGATLATLGSRARIRREPRGTCLIIAPWNYPFQLALSPLVSCLAAGNSAILKPSELAPATSALIARMVADCFPPDLVCVTEGGIETATALLALPFDHIFFTGSPEVGKVVMAAAAKTLASVTLELGGKSPVVVGAGADVERAADWIAFGKFANAGQTCIAPDHVYVHLAVQGALKAALEQRIARAYGPGESPHLARIISPRHAERLRALLREARAGGAEVSTSETGQGTALPPILIEGLTPEMGLAREEIFGPILPLLPFTDLGAVIAEINSRPKPLALYIFESRQAAVDQIIAETSSGGVGVNATLLHYTHHGLPFGGVNHSGHGQAHGEWGFLSFSHQRAVLATRVSPLKLLFPPYRPAKERLARWLTRLLG